MSRTPQVPQVHTPTTWHRTALLLSSVLLVLAMMAALARGAHANEGQEAADFVRDAVTESLNSLVDATVVKTSIRVDVADHALRSEGGSAELHVELCESMGNGPGRGLVPPAVYRLAFKCKPTLRLSDDAGRLRQSIVADLTEAARQLQITRRDHLERSLRNGVFPTADLVLECAGLSRRASLAPTKRWNQAVHPRCSASRRSR